MISLLVAYAHDGVIGKDNDLPWYLPADLKRFKELTTGQAVIMGRKTFDSIIARNGKPLPNRTNIIVTRDANYSAEGAVVAHSLDEALSKVPAGSEAFVIGGAQMFALALPIADRICATEIDADIDGDVHFPNLDRSIWRQVEREDHEADERNEYNYSYVTYEKSDE